MNEYIFPIAVVAIFAIVFGEPLLFSVVLLRVNGVSRTVFSDSALFTSDQVLRLLAQNPTWTASAPADDTFPTAHVRCEVDLNTGRKKVVIYNMNEEEFAGFHIRSDWSIERNP
jgi:hypothetical protein